MKPGLISLVSFAVKEEAKPFRTQSARLANVEILLTGMGKSNAEAAIRKAISTRRPDLVLTCGFAGGLRPELISGAVLFDCLRAPRLEPALLAAGARPAKFHCAAGVATTAIEKRQLWQQTGADAVEMESQIICAVCDKKKISSAIVRVILDTAGEDLPLDFNSLMNDRQEMDYGKLSLTLLKAPSKISALLRLQKQSEAAAQCLARVLLSVLEASPTRLR